MEVQAPSSECAEAQTEELLALQSIFGEDCQVENEAPGAITFQLFIDVDLGVGSGHVQLRAEVGEEGDVDLDPSAASSTEPGPVASSSSTTRPEATVLELAEQRILGRSLPPKAPALERSKSGKYVASEAKVKHLPPLTLQVGFPPGYPDSAAPEFHLESCWLNVEQLSRLCQEMDVRAAEMPGLPIIFAWAEMLRGEAASLLGLDGMLTLTASSQETEDMRAVAECMDPMNSLIELLQYDRRKELELWRQQVHCCQICFSEKPGSQFVHLGGCSHAFCAECVGEMARLHVAEGSILDLKCPIPDCRAEMVASTLEQVLPEEAYERWLRLKIQQVVTSELENVVFCPRCEEEGVEAPVLAETPASPEEAPMAECRRCSFLFCGKCLGVAHPYIADCISEEERLMSMELRRLEGKTLTPAQKRKQQRDMKRITAASLAVEVSGDCYPPKVDAAGYVEETYGEMREGDEVISVASGSMSDSLMNQRVIWNREFDAMEALEAALARPQPLVVRYRAPRMNDVAKRLQMKKAMEELMTLRALKKDSMPCPKCKVRINRSQGCNHMQCTNCGTHFCYRCGSWMDPKDPYSHFKTSACTTFDTEEVQRVAAEQRRGVDDELRELRAQFGRQEDLFAQFQALRNGVPIRRRRMEHRQNESPCPSCRQWNSRMGTLNHVRCQFCRTSYCHCCRKRIQGVVTNHFRGDGACPQHGDAPAREPARVPE